MAERGRKFWGWGYEGEGLSGDEMELLARALAERMSLPEARAVDPPQISEIELRRPRVAPPPGLRGISSADLRDRAEHTLGKSYHDLVRGLRREYENPPDFVVFPDDETELTAALDWASEHSVAASPTAADPQWPAASSQPWTSATGGQSRSTCAGWAASWRSTAPRGRR